MPVGDGEDAEPPHPPDVRVFDGRAVAIYYRWHRKGGCLLVFFWLE